MNVSNLTATVLSQTVFTDTRIAKFEAHRLDSKTTILSGIEVKLYSTWLNATNDILAVEYLQEMQEAFSEGILSISDFPTAPEELDKFDADTASDEERTAVMAWARKEALRTRGGTSASGTVTITMSEKEGLTNLKKPIVRVHFVKDGTPGVAAIVCTPLNSKDDEASYKARYARLVAAAVPGAMMSISGGYVNDIIVESDASKAYAEETATKAEATRLKGLKETQSSLALQGINNLAANVQHLKEAAQGDLLQALLKISEVNSVDADY